MAGKSAEKILKKKKFAIFYRFLTIKSLPLEKKLVESLSAKRKLLNDIFFISISDIFCHPDGMTNILKLKSIQID